MNALNESIDRRGFAKGAALTSGFAAAALLMGTSAPNAMADETESITTDRDAFIDELMAKQAILDKLHDYQRSMDRCDAELGYSVFWEEATIDCGPYFDKIKGWDFVDNCVYKAHPGIFCTSHQVNNVQIKVNGDKAGSESYCLPYMLFEQEDGSYTMSLAAFRYLDKWEKRDGEWRIIERESVCDGSAYITSLENIEQYGHTAKDKTDRAYEFLAYGMGETK